MYVFMIVTDTYLSNEINTSLEWTPPSNKRHTKLVSEINKRRGVQSIKYGIYCMNPRLRQFISRVLYTFTWRAWISLNILLREQSDLLVGPGVWQSSHRRGQPRVIAWKHVHIKGLSALELHWIYINLTLQQRCELKCGAHHQSTSIALALQV